MIIFQKILAIQALVQQKQNEGRTIGFVPTMGALHQGHLTLVSNSIAMGNFTIASIFVNPTQFNDSADFAKYPKTIDADLLALQKAGCEVVFLPSLDEMYPHGVNQPYHIDLGEIEHLFEGFYRPGHFQGVCQVVEKLLDSVKPHLLYLGQKDFQQCTVIKKMIEIRQIKVEIMIVSTIREASGLAMSSRNTRLSPKARNQQAPVLYQQLLKLKKDWGTIDPKALINEIKTNLLNAGFEKIDYVAIADPYTLISLEKKLPQKTAVALIAAFLEGVRLIDNLTL